MKKYHHLTPGILFDYEEETLGEQNKRQLEMHLSGCGICRDRLAEYRGFQRDLSTGLPPVPYGLLERSLIHAKGDRTAAPDTTFWGRIGERKKAWKAEESRVAYRPVGAARHLSSRWAAALVLAVLAGGWTGNWFTKSRLAASGYGAESKRRLQILSGAILVYSEDWDDALPPMRNLEELKACLWRYTREKTDPLTMNEEYFVQPGTSLPYRTNPDVSGLEISDVRRPTEVIILFEPVPSQRNLLWVAWLDGHVSLLTEERFQEALRRSRKNIRRSEGTPSVRSLSRRPTRFKLKPRPSR
jgi:hypothetical protein